MLYTGIVMLKGALKANGIRVSRDRIGKSLRRVDPEGCERRRRLAIKRLFHMLLKFFF